MGLYQTEEESFLSAIKDVVLLTTNSDKEMNENYTFIIE